MRFRHVAKLLVRVWGRAVSQFPAKLGPYLAPKAQQNNYVNAQKRIQKAVILHTLGGSV